MSSFQSPLIVSHQKGLKNITFKGCKMNKLYQTISGTFLLKVMGLGIAFLFQIILGRTLEPAFYGQYTMFITYINILTIIPVFGMDSNLIKEVARVSEDKSKSSSLLTFSVKISLAIYAGISVLLVLFHNILNISLSDMGLFLFMLLLSVLILLLDGFLQGLGLVVKVTVLNIFLNNLMKIIFFLVFMRLGVYGLHSALYSFIVSESITVAFRLKMINGRIGGHLRLKEGIPKHEQSKFLKYSITVALISGMSLLIQNVDKIMISRFLDYSSVGVYKVSQNYVSLIGVFIAPFVAFWPQISKLYHENKISEIEFEMKRIIKIVSYLAIPMFFLFLSINENLLLVFGEMYVTNESKIVLIILSFAYLVDAISGPIGSILTMTNYAKYILVNTIISLTVNVILNYILIMRFGIIGVAMGTGISIILNNLLSIVEVKLLLNIFSYDYTNVLQIGFFSLMNYFLSEYLSEAIKIDNNFLFIIVFGLTLYAVNLVFIGFIQRKKLLVLVNRKREKI